MTRFLLVALFAAFLLPACDSSPTKAAPKTEKSGPAKSTPVAEAKVHDVICGCVLEGINKCGEYVQVDGKYVEFAGDLGLGSMPFCGQSGLKAKVAGKVVEGKFAATSFELLK